MERKEQVKKILDKITTSRQYGYITEADKLSALEQINALYQEHPPKMMICPKANIYKTCEGCPIEEPHEHNEGCDESSNTCPACVPVEQPEMVKPEGLLEQLTEWVTSYKDVASRNALAETPKESADYLLTLIRAELETARLTDEELAEKLGYLSFTQSFRKELHIVIDAQLEAVKKILGKV